MSDEGCFQTAGGLKTAKIFQNSALRTNNCGQGLASRFIRRKKYALLVSSFPPYAVRKGVFLCKKAEKEAALGFLEVLR
ncbi:MAG: hypothetical protein IKA62_04325 [Clostridia bacterium]|nr:hypothetical protein [Clostridia bacterium]